MLPRKPPSLGRPQSAPAQVAELSKASSGAGQAPVPKTNIDPIWSLCPWSVEVTLPGSKQHIEIAAMPAVNWLAFLMVDQFNIFDMVTEFAPQLEDYYFEHQLPYVELAVQMFEVIGVVSARPWWITLRLVHVITQAWHILGPQLMMSNVDASKLSLAAWLDCALFVTMESMSKEHGTMFSMQLEAPLPQSVIDVLELNPEEIQQEIIMDRGAFLSMA